LKGVGIVKISDARHNLGQAQLSVFSASIVVGSKSGAAGSPVLFTGTNWLGNDTVAVDLMSSSGGISQICQLQADSTGTIPQQSCSLQTFVPAGLYTVTASDRLMQISLAKPFRMTPSIAVTTNGSPAAGAFPGSTITVAGAGFAAGSSVAAITLGTRKLSLTPRVPGINANGGFSSVTFKVPQIAHKGYTLTVKDANGNKASVRFAVT